MGKIVVPEVGESITEGVIASWLKADGDFVENGESIYELETDKITTEVPAEESGVLKIAVEAGSTVEIGAEIGSLDPGEKPVQAAGGSTGAAAPQKVEPAVVATQKSSEVTKRDDVLSPAVRRLLTEHQIDPATVSASGKGGRLLKEDVERHIHTRVATSAPVKALPPVNSTPSPIGETPISKAPPPPTIAPSQSPSKGRENRQRMSTLRQRIAERLVASQHGTATLTTFNEADMSSIMDLRKRNKELFKETHGISLGIMSFFVKAAVAALKAYPAVNGSIDGEEIVYHNYYDIGIAVQTDRGLVVPVLRNADQLSFANIEKGITDLALRARDGKLTLQDLQGGTFTISNGGIFGSLLSTPILNPPQSGILGMHGIQKRPVVVDDQIVARPMMYLAMSYDHRLIDGRDSVGFLKTVKDYVEAPGKLLLDLN